MNKPVTSADLATPKVTTGALPASRKIYSQPEAAPDLRVPLREIALDASSGEPPLPVYDTTGAYTDPDVTIDVEGFKFTNASKQQIIEALSIAIEQRQITLIDDPVMLNELDAFEYEVGRTGTVRYNAPEGAHDDCVIALGLALHGVGANGYDLAVLNS
jgi:hypothetical protein